MYTVHVHSFTCTFCSLLQYHYFLASFPPSLLPSLPPSLLPSSSTNLTELAKAVRLLAALDVPGMTPDDLLRAARALAAATAGLLNATQPENLEVGEQEGEGGGEGGEEVGEEEEGEGEGGGGGRRGKEHK